MSVRPPIPRQLPALPRLFTGRAGELAALDEILAAADGRPATVVIYALAGTAGVGKTALALHWAHRVADRFVDGQLYVNLRGFGPNESVMAPTEAIRAFLDAAVPPQRVPDGLDAQAALFRSLLANRRMLLLLDNAVDVDQVRPLLPGRPGCIVLVTSRNHLHGLVVTEGAHPMTLDLLPRADARQLLADRLGLQRVDAASAAVEEIIKRCARLPLALAVAAADAAAHPSISLAEVAARLAEGLDTLDGGDASSDIRSVLSWSYRALSTDAAHVFRLLALHPGPDITLAAAASLVGVAEARLRPRLFELTRTNTLSEHVPDRFVLHDLLRDYAKELADAHDAEDDRRVAARRLLNYYLHTAQAAALAIHPHRHPISLRPPESGVQVRRPRA